MNIFAIIVTYNGMQWVDRCLGSLRASSVPITPIVIDNGSTDGLRDYIPAHFPEAVWLPQESNLGFGQANNIGMKYALEHEADYMLLLNQDAWIGTDTLQLLLEQSDGTSLLTAIHMNGTGEKMDYQFRRSLLSSCPQLFDDYVRNHVASAYETGMFCAAFWFLPTSIVNKVGGFNPLFYHYGEDDNYYNRLKWHGFKSYVVPAAHINHDREVHGNSKMFNSKKMRREMLVAMTNQNLSGKQKLFQLYRVWGRAKSRVFTYLGSLCWLIGQMGRISKSNRMEREERRNWL